ncbi:RING-H2 finger protein ATL74 [Acorus gramineus]|uniref:RING-H2 finger protein ATL74 n=1 Tax=Acorus gramineus TaxID=55184 RepID=A0AAV9B1B0_ACOGR|nr:RING-H2 finger protein ATL74 [Acorus gramineus]
MDRPFHHRFLLDPVTDTPSTATTNGTRPRGGTGAYGGDANFDTNMVIILAALLCALVCALGLNSIVRCALRCGRRLSSSYSSDEAAAEEAAAQTGLKKRALRKIPVAVYGAEEAEFTGTECPICLGEFKEGEKVRVLPECNHGFHVGCIDTWLVSRSSCPTCRHSLVEKKSGPGKSGRGGAGEVVLDVDRVS